MVVCSNTELPVGLCLLIGEIVSVPSTPLWNQDGWLSVFDLTIINVGLF